MADSPTARRRRLAIELKKLREESGLTCNQIGEALHWSGSKVNRLETGNGRVQPSDVDALCRFYATSEELRELLMALAKDSKVRGWWQAHGTGVPPGSLDTSASSRQLRTCGSTSASSCPG